MTFSTGAAGQKTPSDAMTARRREAQRNRERLLAEARTLVGEKGTSASLEEIARRSGLGIATLYRHFSSRTELMRALYKQANGEIAAAASAAFETEKAWAGVELYVESVAQWLISNPGLPAVIEYMSIADAGYHPSTSFERSIAELIERAHAEGELREDVDAGDLALLIYMLGSLSPVRPKNPERELHWRRQLGIVLDGLRAPSARSALPGYSPNVLGFTSTESEVKASAHAAAAPRCAEADDI